MAITFDGQRSLRRKALASRTLESIVTLGVPAKTVEIDGFRFKALNLGDIQKGRVTAPMGASVVCSQPAGATVLELDYWLSGVTAKYPLKGAVSFGCMDSSAADAIVFAPGTEVTFGHQNVPSTITPRTDIGEFVSMETTAFLPGHPCTLYSLNATHCYGGVGRAFITRVVTQSGDWDNKKRFNSIQPIFVDSDGVLSAACVHGNGAYTFTSGGSMSACELVAVIQEYPWFVSFDVPASELFGGIPNDSPYYLRNSLVSAVGPNPIKLGTYAFSLNAAGNATILHAIDASAHPLIQSPPEDHPEYASYAYYVARYDMNTGGFVFMNKTYLLPKLQAISGLPLATNAAAIDMLIQLFGWPNRHEKLPPDNAMFHDDSGNTYTWTRKYGTVRWNSSGLTHLVAPSFTPPSMPTAVTATVGVRPEIYRLGGGQYLCIAYKPGKVREYDLELPGEIEAKLADWVGVRGVYLGTPFSEDSWTEIPAPSPDTHWLLHVRPVSLESENIRLLGIIGTILEAEEDVQAFALVTYKDAAWQILSPLPIEVADPDMVIWSSGLFGEHPMVEELRTCPAQPPSLPQMPALPYTLYSGIIP